eukprot:563048-Prymnesium_polylepis.2
MIMRCTTSLRPFKPRPGGIQLRRSTHSAVGDPRLPHFRKKGKVDHGWLDVVIPRRVPLRGLQVVELPGCLGLGVVAFVVPRRHEYLRSRVQLRQVRGYSAWPRTQAELQRAVDRDEQLAQPRRAGERCPVSQRRHILQLHTVGLHVNRQEPQAARERAHHTLEVR